MARPQLPGTRWIRFVWSCLPALPLLAALALVAPAQQQPGTQPPSTQPPGQPPAPPAAANPADQALSWLTEARRNYTAVRDYQATLMKRERVKGVLQEENIIMLVAKTQPFSIYMKWLNTRSKGQEVAYVQGKNQGMMRVQSKGIGGIAGFVNISPNDRRVLEHSRHTINEAGLGNLIEQCYTGLENDRRSGRAQIRTADNMQFNNRVCLRMETIRPDRGSSYCYRSVLYLDKASKLPVRMEVYDWPTQGGNPEGELLEMFSYLDLRFNTGVTDDFFVK